MVFKTENKMNKYSELNNISILAIGITKNGGNILKNNINKLLKLRKIFKKFDFYIFENDSKDNTVEYLENFSKKNTNFNYISEKYSNDDLKQICKAKTLNGSPCRIELISHARNFLQNKIKPLKEKYDYILNIDLDVLFFSKNSIPNTLLRFKDIDFNVITGCGITKWFRYRDAYAFRSKYFPYGPEYLGTFWWKNTLKKIQQRYKRNQKILIQSGFGGAAIYKTEAYFSSNYSPYADDDFDKMQKEFVKEIKTINEETKKHLSDKPIPNTNYDSPIICEHVPFHFKMIKNGYDKIYLDTSWIFMFRD